MRRAAALLILLTGASPAPVRFACLGPGGARSDIHATFGDHQAVLKHGSETITVAQTVSADGGRYEGSGVLFWNKGRKAMVEWRGVKLDCETDAAGSKQDWAPPKPAKGPSPL